MCQHTGMLTPRAAASTISPTSPAFLPSEYRLAGIPPGLGRRVSSWLMRAEPPVIVFSDVESLHASPPSSASEAGAALRGVAASNLPLVFCSTRTRAEVECLQQDLGVRHPFVCENGAAVFVPRGYFGFDVPHARIVAGYEVLEFGRPYAEVVTTLHRTARWLRIDVIGFHDMSIADVAHECGVPLLEARLAKLREYGEPFRIAGADSLNRQRLFKALWTQGFGCTTGGRYDYVGTFVDEGVGIGQLCRLYRQAFGSVLTVGFGDPARELPLLGAVDIPIAVPGGDVPPIVHRIMKRPASRTGVAAGVAGWADPFRWFDRFVSRRTGLTRAPHAGCA